MANILDMFNQPVMLDYLKNRTYAPLLGETLFPSVKKPTLKFEYIRGGGNAIPTIANAHAFNTEADIASRSTEKQALEAAYIKRKIGMDEEMLIALENPRDAQEEKYLKEQVFNDTDEMVRAVNGRIEAMRMEVLARGRVTLNENKLNKVVDYLVPAENKQVLSGTSLWSDPASKPLEDMLRWATALNGGATRVLTSSAIVSTLLNHPNVISGIFGTGSSKFLSRAELNAFLSAHQLPVIGTYDAYYNKEDEATGVKTKARYFPNNAFVMFGDGPVGQTVFGPTPLETRLRRDPSVDLSSYGNVMVQVYEEGHDPISTWTLAAATAIPSFPAADEVFQAQPIA